MSSTTDTPFTAGTPVADVSGLDVHDTLLAAASARRTADCEEARLVALAVHAAHLYLVDEDTPVASFSDQLLSTPDEDDPIREMLAGAGTPMVAERAVEELAAALDISYRAGCGLVADALELSYRLPRLWALVNDGRLQAWRARKVAACTTRLSAEAAAFVDAQAAIAGARNRLPVNLKGLIQETRVRFDDPDLVRGQQEADEAERGVTVEYDGETAGTATLTAHMDLLDALDLDDTVSDLANQMGRLGDSSPLGVRRAHALGLLAQPQRALDLFGRPHHDNSQRDDDPGSDGPAQPHGKTLATTGSTVYVHVDAEDLRSWRDGGCVPGTVEKLGAATLDLIRAWLQRTSQVTIKPVLDMDRADAFEGHDPPKWMRDLVILRDGHCVFPGCGIDARRCDLDHIIPYVPLDEGGPPGPTSPANLACLCRRHHRLKTFTTWRYQRAGPGVYRWSDPHGLTYESRPIPKAERGSDPAAR